MVQDIAGLKMPVSDSKKAKPSRKSDMDCGSSGFDQVLADTTAGAENAAQSSVFFVVNQQQSEQSAFQPGFVLDGVQEPVSGNATSVMEMLAAQQNEASAQNANQLPGGKDAADALLAENAAVTEAMPENKQMQTAPGETTNALAADALSLDSAKTTDGKVAEQPQDVQPKGGQTLDGVKPDTPKADMQGQAENVSNVQQQTTAADGQARDVQSAMASVTAQPDGQTESNRKSTVQKDDVSAEAVTTVNYRAQEARPDAAVQAESHVTESGEMDPKYADMLKDMIAKQVANGGQEMEITLTPKELGSLLVKVVYEAGKATISIVCSDAKTMQAMSQRASELGDIVEANMGSRTEVIVDSGQRQEQRENDASREGNGNQQEEQQQEAKNRQAEKEQAGSVDFLQQLRLGLV